MQIKAFSSWNSTLSYSRGRPWGARLRMAARVPSSLPYTWQVCASNLLQPLRSLESSGRSQSCFGSLFPHL